MKRMELNRDRDLMQLLSNAFRDVISYKGINSIYQVRTPAARGVLKKSIMADGVIVNLIDLDLFNNIRFGSGFTVRTMVEMGFSTKGVVQTRMKGHRQEFGDYPGQSYLTFAQGEMEIEVSIPGGQHIQIVEAHFSPRVFDEYCRNSGCALPRRLQSYAEYCRESVVKCACVLPSSMKYLLQNVLSSVRECSHSSLDLEESVSDLTAGIVSYLKRGMQASGPVLSARDIERIREARYILERRMEDPPSLLELSHIVNLNDYKLKTGFRQAFGCTVHQALVEMRLSRAKDLLLEKSLPVTEAALAVGYSNLGDFSIAFRKRFGISPRRMRREISGLHCDWE